MSNRQREKENLSMAGEYAVASEVCRRGSYAQVTLGHLKKTDLLVYDEHEQKEAKIEVKSKRGMEWPGVKGIAANQSRLLVLVDFREKKVTERPDFYVLDARDWQEYLRKYPMKSPNFDRLDDGYTPVYKDGWKGSGIKSEQVAEHKEAWGKLKELLK